MRNLIIKYVAEISVNLDVLDYQFTSKELSDLVDKEVEKKFPNGAEGLYWEWDKEPEAKDYLRVPPEEFWFESAVGKVASNRWILILKHFDLPENFAIERPWIEAAKFTAKDIERLNTVLTKDYQSMPLHKGLFRESFLCLKELDGVEVRGEGEQEPGYLLINGVLSAGLMPQTNARNDGFRFHE